MIHPVCLNKIALCLFTKLVYANDVQGILHSMVSFPIERSAFYSLDQNLPSPYPSGLWKPPRSN